MRYANFDFQDGQDPNFPAQGPRSGQGGTRTRAQSSIERSDAQDPLPALSRQARRPLTPGSSGRRDACPAAVRFLRPPPN